MAMPTLQDVIAVNSATESGIILNEAARPVPEVSRINAAEPIEGTEYKSLVVEDFGTAVTDDPFKKTSDGVDNSNISMINRKFTCYPIEVRAQATWDTVARMKGGMSGYLDTQARLLMQAKLQGLAHQFYYADQSSGAKGFHGLIPSLPLSSKLVHDAKGTTAAGCASVVAVRWDTVTGVCWTVGEDGRFDFGEIKEGLVTGANGKQSEGAWRTMMGHIGLAIKSQYAIGAIHNLDATHPFTDDLLDELYGSFPTGFAPNAFYLCRSSLKQLKQSRTATTQTGAPAPWPNVYASPAGDIPLIQTDSLLDIRNPIAA